MAAHYLLAMLIGADARGAAGARIDRVGLQRAAAGFPLDDVIVHGRNAAGADVTLEIQVKRTVTFAPGDSVFADVVRQIASAIGKGALDDPEHRFGVAIARRSAKIDGAYQDVLTWARQLSAAEFFRRLANAGEGNDDARRFVATFRERLAHGGNAVDDELLWSVLRRFLILPFDFGTAASADETLGVERATRGLETTSPGGAATLWKAIGTEALDKAAAGGGEIDRDTLVAKIAGSGQYRLAGRRDFRAAGAALAEMTRHALVDIDRDIAGVVLSRQPIVEAVHVALDQGRYVEIRGGAGVGKSAVLRHFAEQAEPESPVILLTPNRTIGPGWTALRDALQVPGTAREFLADLAIRGGGLLLIDNLDFFSGSSERATVVDLIREAVAVSSFRVIVTARREFGVEEPSWIPADAVLRLGAAPPVHVGDLGDQDIEALREGAPALGTLLSDSHPAKAIVRNPYRLARLAALPDQGRRFRSEVDMAEDWWRTGDGPIAGRRERRRVLATLADAALDGSGSIDASGHDAGAIDALIQREAVIETGTDQLSFRHDVLREWAGAARLQEREALEALPVDKPLPSFFARMVDLAARFALEQSSNSEPWDNMLGFLSTGTAHASWRRPAILALVRSEISAHLLERTRARLFDDNGRLLRETIRTTLAVETQDGRQLLGRLGIDISALDSPFFMPSNASWRHLVVFALRHADTLPALALDDVLALFERFSIALLGQPDYTRAIVGQVYAWLSIVEAERGASLRSDQKPKLTAGFTWSQLYEFESDLRRIFVSFANSDPELAKAYLRGVAERPHPEEIIKSLLKNRGQLAMAAPKELVDLTLLGLNSSEARGRRRGRHDRDDTASYIDSSFLPVSPAQGPFLELLLTSPEEGLRLIHALVDHVILQRSGGKDPGFNGYRLVFEDGERFFPWIESYALPRPYSDPYSVACAMMALEAWGHRRIEAGEEVAAVLNDVLGSPGSPAAYLQVAVDLILSHWIKTRAVAVPFVACAALLSNDRQRLIYDNRPEIDLFGWGDIGPEEPKGIVQLASLIKRVSRRASLEDLLGRFALSEKDEHYARLRLLQQQEIERLGPPAAEATFASPALMALHAYNATDPDNYRAIEGGGHIFEAPGKEALIAEKLAEGHAPRARESAIEEALNIALERKSSPKLAVFAVEYGQAHMDSLGAESGDERWMQGQTVWSAALVAARDGSAELVSEHEAWIREVFGRGISEGEDPVHRMRGGIRFNPLAIATAGLANLWVRLGRDQDRRSLLEIAAMRNPAGAHGIAVAYADLAQADPRLPGSILRCALAATVSPVRRYDQTEGDREARNLWRTARARGAVDAELAWQEGSGTEPGWPSFPEHDRIYRRPIQIGNARIAENDDHDEVAEGSGALRVDTQAGALWLKTVAAKMSGDQSAALGSLVLAYSGWTGRANGFGLAADKDLSSAPDEWNTQFYSLIPRLAGTIGQAASRPLFEEVAALPDRHFYDAAGYLMLAVDDALFNRGDMSVEDAQWIRTRFAARLVDSGGWHRASFSIEYSVEHHLGPAVAAMMFNHHNFLKPPNCYLLEAGIEHGSTFLPILQTLFGSGPIFMVLLVLLNFFEVAPRGDHASFLIDLLTKTLARTEGNAVFWVDHGVGKRAVALLDRYIGLDPALIADPALPCVLAGLICAGVTEAVGLERRVVG
ncbi:hypothetical protein [Sphingomonas sp. Leaf28]|uniref:hypothetical protein n=1 Tax=Sphingomonas sp. Leaf28 TaxID=1735695 RepID=UPI000ACF7FA5|nr:hypothetical protein [Sphingomonas sp. Leaf28]